MFTRIAIQKLNKGLDLRSALRELVYQRVQQSLSAGWYKDIIPILDQNPVQSIFTQKLHLFHKANPTGRFLKTMIPPHCFSAALLGGHVRVGLEDSLWLEKGELAKSNADQVRKIRRILEELSLEIATPDEAREILQTKGRENMNF